MPSRESESLILRTYPLRESDLIVSFLARDLGKLRGVAKRARRPKNPFGAGLERLSHVKMYYFQKENRELVGLDSCDLIHSPFDLQADYAVGVSLDYVAEVSEQLLAPAEQNERFFRLLLAVLDHLRAAKGEGVWQAILYFTLWAVRLSGFLPDLRAGRESLVIASEILTTPIGQLPEHVWARDTAADLRRFLIRRIEEHIERHLITAPLLETL